ncbi:hypothetical protein EV426DRAFT_699656 [Tirmania nivea]|nr:hypothetical protein EV426DRAFT_699656 [Tirmania nivea]
MPTPIHENIANYAMLIILDAIETYTGMSTYDTGKGIRCIIIVRLRPLGMAAADMVFTGVVWEIGFSQTLASLKRRARMWLSNAGMKEDVKIHLVVLVHVFEEEAPKEYLDENREVIMSREKAKRMKWDWPNEWFGNRGVVEEVNRRGGMKKKIKEELKRDIRLRLLEEDEGGRLMPSLMEPLGAKLIVYRRREDVGQAAGETVEDDQPNEDDETVGKDQDLSVKQSSDGEQDSNGEQESLNSADEASDDSDAALRIYQINSIPLMHNDAHLPNLSPHAFSICIAELYGPLPADPHLLNRIPPILRPHANKKIYFPLEKLVETVLLYRKEMRSRRAEEEKLKKEWQRSRVVADSEGRLVGRRVRKTVDVGSREEEEREGRRGADSGSGLGQRGRGGITTVCKDIIDTAVADVSFVWVS